MWQAPNMHTQASSHRHSAKTIEPIHRYFQNVYRFVWNSVKCHRHIMTWNFNYIHVKCGLKSRKTNKNARRWNRKTRISYILLIKVFRECVSLRFISCDGLFCFCYYFFSLRSLFTFEVYIFLKWWVNTK